ncbi:MAG: type II toxin-antitoxin system RelE/ParE family toxin [Dehalococcoidia bacterium]|nr:type II toxin-antitoxin system RelE/ParE family toxin [Dehalococcoidia bacterium]
MYNLILEPSAQRDLKKFIGTVKSRIEVSLDKLKANPRPVASKKLVGFKESWRLRVGGYRVLYEIDDKSRELHVYRIELKGKDTYRR